MMCTRMNSKGDFMSQQYLVDEYSPPGGICDAEKSPKPVIYLWGGGVTTPMILDLPGELVDSKTESVACGRTQRMAVTDDGKVISWKVRRFPSLLASSPIFFFFFFFFFFSSPSVRISWISLSFHLFYFAFIQFCCQSQCSSQRENKAGR